MTITTTFVEMVQNKAMHNIILQNILFPLIISILPATYAMMGIWLEKDKYDYKRFFKVYIIFVVIVSLLMLPFSISDYRLWRDFPAQMIIDKLT